jgi:hypothetical protein
MSTPHVTEIARRMEPVGHDTFIEDLSTRRDPRPTAITRPGPR